MNPLLIFPYTHLRFPRLVGLCFFGRMDRNLYWSTTWLIQLDLVDFHGQDMPMETWDVQPWNNMDQQPGIFVPLMQRKKPAKKQKKKKPAAYQASSSTKGSFLGLTSICSKPTWEGFFSQSVESAVELNGVMALVGTSRNTCFRLDDGIVVLSS